MEISYFAIIIGAILVNNVVLAQFLGICPFLGVSSKVETSMGMGAAVTFVMALAALVAWLIQTYVLVPLDIVYMQTIVFILVIAALVQMVEIILKKVSPSLYQALGIFLPLITTNCAVLGVAILMIQKEFNLLQSVTYSVATAIGFALALVLFAGIREPARVRGPCPGPCRACPLRSSRRGFWPWPSWGSPGWSNSLFRMERGRGFRPRFFVSCGGLRCRKAAPSRRYPNTLVRAGWCGRCRAVRRGGGSRPGRYRERRL